MRYHLNLEQFYDCPIAIYGTGEHANLILNQYKEKLDIRYVIDIQKEGKFFCGKEIVSIEKVQKEGIHNIIICASVGVEYIIYKRISKFCKVYGIRLFGIFSGDMSKTFETRMYGRFKSKKLNREELYQLIDSHDIISFDLFDTLIMRKCLEPTDVFDLVEARAAENGIIIKNFKMKRIRAEFECINKNFSIEKIYEILQKYWKLSDSIIEHLKEIEKEIEREVLFPREEMKKIFLYAIQMKKVVYIVSDMYLSSAFMEEILNNFAMNGYHKIFVSGEYGITKPTGLFAEVLNEIPGKSYLHIGDNEMADGVVPSIAGIDVYGIYSAKEMLLMSECKEIISYMESNQEQLIVGKFAASCFENPFLDSDVLYTSTIHEIVNRYIGPVVTGFLFWLVSEIQNKDIEKVLFLSRDGYLLKKMYDEVRKIAVECSLPESEYFYSSRKAILYVKEEKRHLIGYKKYISSLNLKAESSYVCVDFMSQGTTQKGLEEIFFHCLEGKYFLQYILQNSLIGFPEITSWYKCTELTDMTMYKEYNLFFELFLSSPEPSVDYIDKNGKVVFQKEIRSEKNIENLIKAQLEIFNYFMDILKLGVNGETSISKVFCNKILSFTRKPYAKFKESFFDQFVIENSITGEKIEITSELLKGSTGAKRGKY